MKEVLKTIGGMLLVGVLFPEEGRSQSWKDNSVVTESYFIEENMEAEWASWVEEMDELRDNPLNVNTLNKEQLEQFPFLSDWLIENILYYVFKFGPLVSLNELSMVENMDYQTLKLLRPFLYVGSSEQTKDAISWKSVMKYNKQELSTRVDIPFYTRAGYAAYSDEYLSEHPNKQYVGSSLYHNLRYSFRYKDNVYAGITMEKDPGEQWFGHFNKKGADFYSPYLMLKGIGRLKALVIGNYRASFGYGLVMNTGFSLGKTMEATKVQRQGFSKHSSCDEYNFFQGVGGSYLLGKRWTLSGFYSFRKMDGAVEDNFITSIKKDGYHRLIKDFEKQHTFSNQVAGGNISYNGKNVEFGLTGVFNVFSKVLNPDRRDYNRYYLRGNSFFNVGTSYKFFLKHAVIGGEIAADRQGKIAWMNRVDYRLFNKWNFLLINRIYDKAYQSVYGKSFSESGMVQNEYGVYLGLETSCLKNILISDYVDFFYFPYQKYGISASGTSGFENTLQVSYSPLNSLSMLIKYRYKNKAKDTRDEEANKMVLPVSQHRLNTYFTYTPSERMMFKTAVYFNGKRRWNQQPYYGVLINQQAGFIVPKFPFQLDLSAAWFRTDNYDTRITIYEKNVLYAFSMPSFYGNGYRFSCNLRYSLKDWLVFQVKYGLTYYLDREAISSGTEEIRDCKKGDIYMQLRIKW